MAPHCEPVRLLCDFVFLYFRIKAAGFFVSLCVSVCLCVFRSRFYLPFGRRPADLLHCDVNFAGKVHEA